MSLKRSPLDYSIACYEKATGLTIVVRDRENCLWPYLSPDRMLHGGRFCMAVKLAGYKKRCQALDLHWVNGHADKIREGFCHVCHAGFVEWIAPVWSQGRMAAVLFAGQRRPGASLRPDRTDRPLSNAPRAAGLHHLPAPVEQEESDRILEHLMQVAARLSQHLEKADSAYAPAGSRQTQDRKRAILEFVRRRHTRPVGIEDLAGTLHLSASRTAHVVRDLFGATLQSLLCEERIRTSAALLRTTSFSVTEVAVRCGMGDVSHFHRAFKQRLGVAPGLYRRLQEEASE